MFVSKLQHNEVSWVSRADFSLFCRVSLELLRLRNATFVDEGISTLRNNHEKRGNWVVLGGEGQTGGKDSIPFSGSGISTTENAFSSFVRRYKKKSPRLHCRIGKRPKKSCRSSSIFPVNTSTIESFLSERCSDSLLIKKFGRFISNATPTSYIGAPFAAANPISTPMAFA